MDIASTFHSDGRLGILKIFLVLLSTVLVVGVFPMNRFEVKGDGRPYTPQPSYLNSTLTAYSFDKKAPGIFDDQVKSWIKQYIVPKGYHDMEFVFGECFGGGMMDEMMEFGNDAHPVVAMSASRHDKVSYCVGGVFSYFLESLKDDLKNNPDHTMGQAFDGAKANDDMAQGFTPREDPQYNSAGAGADNLKIGSKGSATSYEAILFAGQPYDGTAWGDIDEMYNLLVGKFGFTDASIEVCAGSGHLNGGNKLPGGGTIDRGATAADLENAIKAVADRMNSSEQLFFWVSDHGDFDGLIQKAMRYITKTAPQPPFQNVRLDDKYHYESDNNLSFHKVARPKRHIT
jgi:hypothetical protein